MPINQARIVESLASVQQVDLERREVSRQDATGWGNIIEGILPSPTAEDPQATRVGEIGPVQARYDFVRDERGKSGDRERRGMTFVVNDRLPGQIFHLNNGGKVHDLAGQSEYRLTVDDGVDAAGNSNGAFKLVCAKIPVLDHGVPGHRKAFPRQLGDPVSISSDDFAQVLDEVCTKYADANRVKPGEKPSQKATASIDKLRV